MGVMWRALTDRKRGRFQGVLPRFESQKDGIVCERVTDFEQLFGWENSPYLHPIFPHILAAPLHMELATRPAFPLPALGLIHVSNDITQHRPILKDAVLDVRVWIEGHRCTALGVEFDVNTHVLEGGVCCWEEVSRVLCREVEGTGKRSPREKPPFGPDVSGTTMTLPSNWGRAYARVSGDWNPIHLYPWTAQPFGFPRHIAHGMAMLASVVSHLPNPGARGFTLQVRFEKPVYLPAAVQCQMRTEDNGTTFVVRGDRPHMVGRMQVLE